MTARENLRRLRESEAELAALEETLLRLDAEAAALGAQELRTLLLLYYVDGCTWDQVAAQMNYAVSYVWKLHRAALQQFAASAESGEEKSRMRV